ncbi:hypothetical protein [Actinocrispum wychmicini]|uniref:Uncharacterized protein n=1 Tax=Actinocrispum wychmicini TaxID=1213861 RepID=A0A4R2IIM0_9PSEU|nr:hypothetical protein [Actinocrispum wychmicini]TCO44703.1 hypothetical protein EV192_12324 [Actinocrispum wychmicini]
MLWLAAQTYLLCLGSFLAGVVVTVLVLRKRKPVPDIPVELLDIPEDVTDDEVDEDEDDEEPAVIKATRKSMRYHTSDSPYYNRLKGDLTFVSVEEAELAGFSAWNSHRTPAAT